MKAAIYTRVSTPGQVEEGESLEMQKERLQAYVKVQGWNLAKAYEDAGYSGGTAKRPAFQQMIADARQKKFDVLLVYKIDRLSRSILDFHTTMKILQDNDISFVSLTQNFDTSTSMGRLMLAILVDFANFEREINVDRSKDSYLNRLNHGHHSGRTPFGYVRREGNVLVPAEEQAQIVKEMFDLAYQKMPSREIAEKFHLTRDRVKSILGNPIYTGYICSRGKYGRKIPDPSKWIKGMHKAIIPLDYFLAVQRVWRQGPKKTKYTGLFQKLIYCPYDKHNFTLAVATKNKKLYSYYWCAPVRPGEKTCGRRITEQKVEQLLLKSVDKLFKVPMKKKKEIDINHEIEKIDKKIERYLSLLQYQDMPVHKIKEKIEELQKNKKRLLKNQKPQKNIKKYFKNIKELYPFMNKEERSRLWKITIEKITLYNKWIVVEWKNRVKTRGSLRLSSKSGAEGGI